MYRAVAVYKKVLAAVIAEIRLFCWLLLGSYLFSYVVTGQKLVCWYVEIIYFLFS